MDRNLLSDRRGRGALRNDADAQRIFSVNAEQDFTCLAQRQEGCDQISSTTPSTIIAMPTPSRALVFCPKIKTEIACANSTSTSARERTLAAVVSAKARNQNCDAVAPMKPAKSDGRHCATIAPSTARSRSARYAVSNEACSTRPQASVNVAVITKFGWARSRIAPRWPRGDTAQ